MIKCERKREREWERKLINTEIYLRVLSLTRNGSSRKDSSSREEKFNYLKITQCEKENLVRTDFHRASEGGTKVENKMKSSKFSSFPLDKILICLIHTHTCAAWEGCHGIFLRKNKFKLLQTAFGVGKQFLRMPLQSVHAHLISLQR